MNKKYDRDQVLKKGVELIWCQGYFNLGVDEICKKSGMTKGAFYNAFKSKENFLLESLKKYRELTLTQMHDSIDDTKEKSIEKLVGLYDAMLEGIKNSGYIGCMVNSTMSEVALSNELVSEATDGIIRDVFALIHPLVKAAQDEGDFKVDIDSLTLTEMIHTTFMGCLNHAKALKDISQGKKVMDALFLSLRV